jgi:hypothetical protein
MIIRVGDIKKNFKNSVLDRIHSSIPPIWGYNSEKCCGLRPVSLSVHNILQDWSNKNNAYVLFLPNSKLPIIGIAKIKILETRESTNEENGWNEPTAIGITEWNIQMNIEKFWDLSKIPILDSIFSYDTINEVHGRRLPQSSILYRFIYDFGLLNNKENMPFLPQYITDDVISKLHKMGILDLNLIYVLLSMTMMLIEICYYIYSIIYSNLMIFFLIRIELGGQHHHVLIVLIQQLFHGDEWLTFHKTNLEALKSIAIFLRFLKAKRFLRRLKNGLSRSFTYLKAHRQTSQILIYPDRRK